MKSIVTESSAPDNKITWIAASVFTFETSSKFCLHFMLNFNVFHSCTSGLVV